MPIRSRVSYVKTSQSVPQTKKRHAIKTYAMVLLQKFKVLSLVLLESLEDFRVRDDVHDFLGLGLEIV
jgi:hypothetical protein